MCSFLNFLDRRLGRRSLVLLLVCALCACSTLRQAPGSGSELQDRIRSGSLVGPGDVVRVSTVSGDAQEFRVTAVEEDTLVGADIRIPIDSITRLEIRDYSSAKKTAKGVAVGVLAIAALCAIALFYLSESMSGLEFSSSGG